MSVSFPFISSMSHDDLDKHDHSSPLTVVYVYGILIVACIIVAVLAANFAPHHKHLPAFHQATSAQTTSKLQ